MIQDEETERASIECDSALEIISSTNGSDADAGAPTFVADVPARLEDSELVIADNPPSPPSFAEVIEGVRAGRWTKMHEIDTRGLDFGERRKAMSAFYDQ